MRILVFLVFVITSAGCSSLMLGGGSAAGNSQQNQATAVAAADAATSKRVKEKFAADAELSKHAISVTTRAGMVRISGIVPSYAIREDAEKAAMTTAGVKAVENQISVE